MWVDALEPGIMPGEHWWEALVPESHRARGAAACVAVDVN